ncbi:hypothetical protein CEXT_462891 [Caerostris extrusa]|uniref:Uncharacterized protein n=1 Tax=Caerostris extrusa TaxID=172846 RepID=A0AAV4TM34_CAEEX|nr:hypothetical protein CEXT_462891 [Caerostris extrusa]
MGHSSGSGLGPDQVGNSSIFSGATGIKKQRKGLSSARNTSILTELEAACHSKMKSRSMFLMPYFRKGHSSGSGLDLDLAGNSPMFSSWGTCGLCFR